MWSYAQGEYLFIILDGLTLHHKTYSISQEEEDFLQ